MFADVLLHPSPDLVKTFPVIPGKEKLYEVGGGVTIRVDNRQRDRAYYFASCIVDDLPQWLAAQSTELAAIEHDLPGVTYMIGRAKYFDNSKLPLQGEAYACVQVWVEVYFAGNGWRIRTVISSKPYDGRPRLLSLANISYLAQCVRTQVLAQPLAS
jgi:hypothetical protein